MPPIIFPLTKKTNLNCLRACLSLFCFLVSPVAAVPAGAVLPPVALGSQRQRPRVHWPQPRRPVQESRPEPTHFSFF